MKNLLNFPVIALVLICSTACTRVETGHAGVRVNFNGSYDTQELGVGFHQTMIGNVITVVANEMTVELNDLKPQTKDKTLMHDMDMTFNYVVTPGQIVELMTAFKGRNMTTAAGDIYPMGAYISNIVTTATSDVIGKYDALDVNNHREEIRAQIMAQTVGLLRQEKLDRSIQVKQIFIKNMQIAPELTASALVAITSENELKAKTIQVQVAEQENKRLAMMSGNSKNMEYMALENQRLFIQKMDGKNTVYVIPTNLTSFMINK